MVEPRTRKTRMRRVDPSLIEHDHVGDDDMEATCPRCGWPCTHLVKSYWASPWNEHGGMCTQCCKEAVAKFDKSGWPATIPEKPVETPRLWDDN